MIKADNLSKSFGSITALSDASFQVEKGCIAGFLGPNGAGKSTAMRILTGFFPASSGRAYIDGLEVHEHPLEIKRRIGYLPEHVPLYEEMSVTAFLSHVCRVKGIGRKALRGERDRIMEHCGLTHMARRLVGHLSKGYRQRVGLAQALAGNPPVLILDEPTVGLDPAQIVEIRNLIRTLGKDHTVLLSTHILPEVAMTCDQVIIINRGRIVTQSPMEQLTMSGSRSLEEVFMSAISSEQLEESPSS